MGTTLSSFIEIVATGPGGEAAFWLDWVFGRIPESVQTWVRERAEELGVLTEITVADQPESAAALHTALAVVPKLVLGEPGDLTAEFTANAADPIQRANARVRVKDILGTILEQVGVSIPAIDETAWLTHLSLCLLGPESLDEFQYQLDWLAAVPTDLSSRTNCL